MAADFDPETNALTKFPAIYDLELRHWSDAAQLQVVPGALRGDQSITYWARAIGAARSGNLEQAHKDLEQIEVIRKEFVAAKKPNTPRQSVKIIRKPLPGSCTLKARMMRRLPASAP